jgi:hypothetical protein
LNFSEAPFTYGVYTDPRGLEINNPVIGILGITAELEIISQAAYFFNHIPSFLAYSGSSVVKTLNQNSSRAADG